MMPRRLFAVALALTFLAPPASAGEAAAPGPKLQDRPLIPPKEVTAPWWPKDGRPQGLTKVALDYVKAREPKDKKTFKFCVVGDTNNPGFHSTGQLRPMSRVFGAVLEEANKLDPDFIIQIGDQAYVGLEWEFEGTLDAYAHSKAPVLTVPGNHDRQANTPAYKTIFGEAPYAFDYGGVRFAMLGLKYVIGPKDMDWLEKALAFDGPKIVAMHIPPWIDYYPGPSGMLSAYGIEGQTKKAEAFKALVGKLKPEIVFMGHIHCYDRHEADGVRWIICAQAHGAAHAAMDMGVNTWLPMEIRKERKGLTQYVPHFVEVRVEDGKVADQVHFLPELNKLDDGLKLLPLPADGRPPELWWRWWPPAAPGAGK